MIKCRKCGDAVPLLGDMCSQGHTLSWKGSCFDKLNPTPDLPELDEPGKVRLETFMKLFESQLWVFAGFLNDSPDNMVPTWKYMDYILYAMKKELDREFPGTKKWTLS